ncbi:MAG TPA: hypothetical protein PL009_10075 [Flavipsychrobacter sp.]|nr:hypothetical protein [Flavipsychrobacter sp.]
MNDVIKQQLHLLIDRCNDELILKEAKAVFENISETDWWNDLTEEDRILIRESETQYEHGNYRSHIEIGKDLDSWKKK